MVDSTQRGPAGYCSWCMNRVHPVLAERGLVARHLYKCPTCRRGIVRCRAVRPCGNFARWDEVEADGKTVKWHHQFCAEHNGTILDFASLTTPIANPAKYSAVYTKKHINYPSAVTQGLITIGTTAVTLPVALHAAPVIGGVVGRAFGLTGVAAVNKGLALLGGGALAAGGFGMAGGGFVVTSVGGVLGATMGAVAANAYFGHIKGFHISRIRHGRFPAVITVNGFLTEKRQSLDDWRVALPYAYRRHAWFHLNWEAANLAKLGGTIGRCGGGSTLRILLAKAAQQATKQAGKRLAGPFSTALAIELASNPWHVTLRKAQETGIVLGDIIRRCRGKKFILCGHSLGARVIANTLTALGSQNDQILEVHLFGGAVDANGEAWKCVAPVVAGKICNYYSTNDMVLKYLYSVGTFFRETPIGRGPIKRTPGIRNIDVSGIVPGHMAYKTESVGRRIITKTWE